MRELRHRARPIAIVAATAACLALVTATATAQTPGVPPSPIPQSPTADPDPFIGSPATPRRVDAPRILRHPFMAPNGLSNIHNDGYQSDTYRWSGPLGRTPETTSTYFNRECASISFDSRGRLVSVCVGLDKPVLAMFDPDSLETLAAMDLPPRMPGAGNPFTDFSGGGYFYLDNRDRAVVSTSTRHLLIVKEVPGPDFEVARDFDLSGAVPSDAKIISALPDWDGRIWFAGTDGTVGWVDPRTGRIQKRALDERISNSFAVGPGGGVFIVTDTALYRLEARNGRPAVIWRRGYPNNGEQKPGQTSPGSGTTPTLIKSRYVAITDNADPLGIVVMDRRRKAKRGDRVICREPVFSKGRGSTDQSLIGIGRSIVTENNYGYSIAATENGGTTEAGIQRVDIRPARRLVDNPTKNCRTVWRSNVRAPSVVPKLSLGAGLVYTYTKPRTDDGTDPWYLTALDFRDGSTVYKTLSGEGLGYNNNYAPITLSPAGVAYVGVLGGLVRIAD